MDDDDEFSIPQTPGPSFADVIRMAERLVRKSTWSMDRLGDEMAANIWKRLFG